LTNLNENSKKSTCNCIQQVYIDGMMACTLQTLIDIIMYGVIIYASEHQACTDPDGGGPSMKKSAQYIV
jgi:hypothetical protein